ncbi:hypothetical protein DIJ64_02455 [Mycobacterium leprae]|uniref:Uncharacterized protein n=1 Tax=Mycobacterium leprae TaxID=1769 RepID=A0AAD0P7V7_MYCLR|nr:hypothetical protein DIJ64_02455 [Mycobacterium leprae]OAR20623.1 hypothetical protein A8144_10050 [Mycobacterium leprae 3125609]OAX70813.1 hypothetical protein A3216_09735 [Mycobacterium leprae 7935681]
MHVSRQDDSRFGWYAGNGCAEDRYLGAKIIVDLLLYPAIGLRAHKYLAMKHRASIHASTSVTVNRKPTLVGLRMTRQVP